MNCELTLSILTGLMLDLKTLTNLSPAYSVTGTAKYIQVCHKQNVAFCEHDSVELEAISLY